MRMLTHACSILLGLATVDPASAIAQEEIAQEESTAAVQELVAGDQYTIRIERNGASESYTGVLVQVQTDWIVLQREEVGPQAGVPVSQRPFFQRTFKNIGVGREEHLVWLPREAATIVQRVQPHERAPLPAIEGVTPPRDQLCHIDYAEAGELKQLQGTLTHEEGTDLKIVSETMVAEQKSVPLLGGIPIVGRAFQRQVLIRQHREQKLAREDVLAVRVKAE